MSIYYSWPDEESMTVSISFKKRAYYRRVQYVVYVPANVVASGYDNRIATGTDYAQKNQAITHKHTFRDLPPNTSVYVETVSHQKEGSSWEFYESETTHLVTAGMSTSKSVAAVNQTTGKLTITVSKHRSNSSYKVYAKLAASSGGTINKTFTLNAGANSTAASVSQTFNLTGLKPNTTYTVTYSIYHIYKGKERLGASNVSAGSFKTPAVGVFNPGVTVTDVKQNLTTHQARVYWEVAAGSTPATYKLFYTDANGDEVDAGAVTPPASGYSTVTIADLNDSRDVTFFIRCYPVNTASTVYTVDHADSNEYTEYMYSQFSWIVSKTAGESAVVTAEEWNRCKQWVAAKNNAFEETEAYQTITGKGMPITNEEMQAVLDALLISQTVNDGSAITAATYNAIATAINS